MKTIYGVEGYKANKICIHGEMMFEIDLSSGWCIGQIEYDDDVPGECLTRLNVTFIRIPKGNGLNG